MAEYQAKSINSLTFDLTKSEKFVGKLTYKSWFKFDAAIELANKSNYKVVPKGFWGTTIEVKDGTNVLLKFKMNWSGDIVVQTYFNNTEKDYMFKHRGVFKESYVLLDQEGTEIVVMKPHVRWRTMNYSYEIATTESFEASRHKEILLMNSLHCANYYLSMLMSSG